MPTDQSLSTLGNKSISELIGDDVRIDPSGAVTGEIKYVSSWPEFDTGHVENQKGFFFPIKLDESHSGKKITVKGKQTKTVEDLEWILRFEDTSATFTFTEESQDAPFLTLSFTGASLTGKPAADAGVAGPYAVKASAKRRVAKKV